MPSKETVRRQRSLGGLIGVGVLTLALAYHFFPRLFHVDPAELAARQPTFSTTVAGASVSTRSPDRRAADERDAGPPLKLAPAAVIAEHQADLNAVLPQQKSPDPPLVEAWLTHADAALVKGDLASPDGAAAWYARALKEKPDSRRAAKGLYEVHARLVVETQRSIAAADAEAAARHLDELKSLPDSAADVARLQARLSILARVRPMLAQAAALLRQGRVDQPQEGSAWSVYRQILRLDPDNSVANQGIDEVQRVVLERALAAVAQNDYPATDKALALAAAIVPASPRLDSVRRQVADIRQQRAAMVLAQARSALDGGNPALAEQLSKQAEAISPGLPGLPDLHERLVNARLYAGYRPGQVFADRYVDMPGQTPLMVVVPAGHFLMGAPDGQQDRSEAEQPQHPVAIEHGFALSRTAVTVAQFREFVRSSGYRPDSLKRNGASVYDERSGSMRDDGQASWQDDYAGKPAADDLPVVNVSWNDAKAYADWLSQRTGLRYRLPSEAEFEYALRGGTATRYWWGDGTPDHPVENVTGGRDRSPSGRRWSHAFRRYGDGYWGPAPVMRFAANPFGLYDIDGNVSAWVQDCWHDNYNLAPRYGGAWVNPGCTARVIRGGSWESPPAQLRSAYRQAGDGELRSGQVGIRILREL